MNKIGFIGAGNMASSLIAGLIANAYPANLIWASNPSPEKLQRLSREFHIQTTSVNTELLSSTQVIILCVKPNLIRSVLEEIAPMLKPDQCIISVAAGIVMQQYEKFCPKEQPIIRAMPNTPVFVQSGVTGLYANHFATKEQCELTETIFRSVGITQWLEDEHLLEVITALSGSGPAYFFYFMQAMEEYGIAAGLTPEIAHLLTLQTGFGAIKLALETQHSLETLRARVTSKGGATAAAIGLFEKAEFHEMIHAAMSAAQKRARELGA